MSKAEIAQIVARMASLGYTPAEIGRCLVADGVKSGTRLARECYNAMKLRAEAATTEQAVLARQAMAERLHDITMQLLRLYEASGEPVVTQIGQPDGRGGVETLQITKRSRSKNARILNMAAQNIEREAAMLGLSRAENTGTSADIAAILNDAWGDGAD